MARLRIATYNVEWMNNWFEPGKALIRTKKGTGKGRNPVDSDAVARKVAAVITDLDADIIGIQEGPLRTTQMEFFVKTYLKGAYDVFGMESGVQSIYALVRKGLNIVVEQVPKSHKFYSHLRKPVVFQPWGKVKSTKPHKMARPPVLLRVRKPGEKGIVHVIVAHTKSQFTPGFTVAKFRTRDMATMKAAVLSRQKLSADVAAYRRHVTHAILSEKEAIGVILMGDLNDGFARGVFEREFLMQSLVDELRGSFRRQSALLEHVMNQKQLAAKTAYTIAFRNAEQNGKITKELIDHILITPAICDRKLWLKFRKNSAAIGHDISARHTTKKGKGPDDHPSDHAPMWADFDV
jgi:exonuclease III